MMADQPDDVWQDLYAAEDAWDRQQAAGDPAVLQPLQAMRQRRRAQEAELLALVRDHPEEHCLMTPGATSCRYHWLLAIALEDRRHAP